MRVVEVRIKSAGKTFEGPSPLGLVVSEHVDKIAYFEPTIEILDKEVDVNGIRFTMRLSDECPKSVDEIVRGFKIGCFKIAREYKLISPDDPTPIFAPDFSVSE